MQKSIAKRRTRTPEIAARVKRTAELTGVSRRQVYRVIEGKQMNEKIIETYMFLMEGEENLLLQAVERAVQFEN